ncbi:M28 family peptidase [Soonwooa sp.]|uniref:M28 family peptidase n=1 Tax=Soonwooa sp. TaxID=1938592 RepID=UPI00260E6BB5|nr:M28 family peptidase [Soonwooa sp.]
MTLKSSLLIASAFVANLHFGQSANPYYKSISEQVTQYNITNNLQEFENIGVKTTGSSTLTNALSWLKNKYTSFGYSASDISEQSFSYLGSTSKNLIITKTGTKYPNTFVIICGHYDTLNGPGTNDNGSGVSVILEVARIMKNIDTDYSIKFINFSGEEQGLIGSSAYVKNVVNATSPKMDIKLVFNIDEVGGVAGKINNQIMCERDESNNVTSNNAASAAITQDLMTYVGYYSTLQPKLSHAYNSDYMPFEANGEVITGFYEANESTYPHSSGDTFSKLDPTYVYNVAKAATGAMMHFSGAKNQIMAVCTPADQVKSLEISPNPAKNYIQLEFLNKKLKDYDFKIVDTTGKTLLVSKNEDRINVEKLKKGLYFGTLTIDGVSHTKKILID